MFISPELIAQCVYPQPDGTLIFTADTALDCTGHWLIPATEYSAYLSSVEITATDVASSFTWGFGIVLFFAFLAYQVDISKKLINKV